ncbi:pyridoxal phosphate-dependent decarboxylase family protein [Amycolatopsis magusensis]|uniref:Glutamate/tyrosine decarboxylase-like PLP-dependent enzyme n=1 Tax=Amycolatopsis magusensis TaxID=882444 RepID=A0ABS4PUN8_9PSEU|nr:aminotransferase class V-fold PLP-dependent enzyme [Amycolatopsis magusensis]MBP2183139.1 glutamate/tyrosine decarboxylase-like PLP-dependent enzyme [Amycolatopsis magusensis]
MTSAEDVLAELRALRAGDLPTHGARTLAYVYDSGLSGVDELAAGAHALAAHANGLDPTAFPSLLRLENDLVAATADLVGATGETVGAVTSGGTESCLLAVLAARTGAPEVREPAMVLPETAHAAFQKAAHFFGVRAVPVPVDPVTFRADPAAMAAAMDEHTVLVVASAPSYAHGVVDPIAEIAAAVSARGIRMHVDACIGGWVLPHLGVPPFGFGVPGVTSVSVDLHKYAYCPKGVSVLLHANAGLRRGHYFASADWPGYTMLNSTVQSTRSGGPLAAAWAVVRHIGPDGYRHLALEARAAAEEIAAGIGKIDGLRVLGSPDSTLVAFALDGTPGFDLFTVADEMSARKWYVQPQFAHGVSPENLHLTLSAANRGHEPEFLADLEAAVSAARATGPVTVDPQIAEFVAALDPDQLTSEQFAGLLGAAGLGEGSAVPARMAEVNTLLAAAPARLRERLLLEFLGQLHH